MKRPSPSLLKAARLELTQMLGETQVLADPDLMMAYAEDASGAGAYPPDLVVRARRTEDVQTVLRVASKHGVYVTPRGLGTGKSGGALPVYGGIVLSLEKMNRVHEVNRDDMLVVADAGTITRTLMDAVEAEQLFYPPDPNSLDICSIGGNVACNAGGPRALKYGVTKNYVLGVEVVLPSGQVLTLGKHTIKQVTGYDLTSLIVGSEGTLGVITKVVCRLVPKPIRVETALVSFQDVRTASLAITRVLTSGIVPRTLEFLDSRALDAIRGQSPGRFPEEAHALLILETDGQNEAHAFGQLEAAASVCLDAGALDVTVAQSESQRAKIWEPRRILSTTLTEQAPCKISDDISVPRSQIPKMLEEIEAIAEKSKLRTATYGHAGDGNLHVNVLFNPDERPKAEHTVEAVLKAALALGGTISGEHGIGLLKRDFLPLEQSDPLIALQKNLKKTFDPHGLLNPGKIFPARAPTE